MASVFWDSEGILLLEYLKMVSVFWDSEGILLLEYLKRGYRLLEQ
jgi:hypothetical protein